MSRLAKYLAVSVAVPVLIGAAAHFRPVRAEVPAVALDTPAWHSFLTVDRLIARLRAEPNLVLVDARSPAEYADGHLPGAISLPGRSLRTVRTPAAPLDDQNVFHHADGSPDVGRYEKLLGAAGLRREDAVVVYGNHAGKADGSVPAMLLDWLGQRDVAFLDGVGPSEWLAAGRALTVVPTVRPPAVYRAKPRPDTVLALPAVLADLHRPGVVFLDARTAAEFAGQPDNRGNRFGGHLPGAVDLPYADLLTARRTLVPRDRILAMLAARGITPDKTVVLYCQSATRVSLPYLVLKDLGYKKVAFYDASWGEYGNRSDTPKETGVD